MQEAEESAAETDAQSSRAFHLIAEGRIVQGQFAQGFAQFVQFRTIDREERTENDLNGRFETFHRDGCRFFRMRNRVTDFGRRDIFYLGGDKADFARSQFIDQLLFRRKETDTVDRAFETRRHKGDLVVFLQRAFHDARQNDDTQIRVIPAIDEQRLERCIGRFRFRRRQSSHDRFQ